MLSHTPKCKHGLIYEHMMTLTSVAKPTPHTLEKHLSVFILYSREREKRTTAWKMFSSTVWIIFPKSSLNWDFNNSPLTSSQSEVTQCMKTKKSLVFILCFDYAEQSKSGYVVKTELCVPSERTTQSFHSWKSLLQEIYIRTYFIPLALLHLSKSFCWQM